MRLTTALVFSAIGAGSASALAADVVATSAIDAVTVFPSGAEITRLAKVKLEGGEGRIVFPDLPAQAVPGSIRVEGKSTGKLDIGSVDTKRLFVPRTDAAQRDSERRSLEDQIEVLRDARSLLEGQTIAAQTQTALLSNLAELPKVPPVAGQPGTGVDWKSVLATIGLGSMEAKKLEIEAQTRMRDVDRQIKDLQGKLRALPPAKDERTEVAVNVSAGAALDADLTVRYQVPSASWAAFYDARLSTGSKAAPPKLDLIRQASITQNSGEPWTNVALSLSTTRPTVGASAPEISTTTVDYVPDAPPPPPAPIAAAPAPQVMMRSARPKAAMHDMAVDAVAGAAEPAMEDARARNADVVQAPFQAIYGVPGRVTVLPANEAKKVQLMEETIEPALSVRTVPRLDAKGFLYAKLVLPKSSAVLPGQVSLFRDGTFVGTGRLPLLAAGEEHDLGFGADDAIRVKHAIADDKRGEKGLISSSKTDTRNFKITIKNLHERAIPVTVFDSIPVSQQQDIKVTLTARPQPTKQDVDDKRGVLSWDLKLDADQEQVIEFGYQVVWPGAKAITYR